MRAAPGPTMRTKCRHALVRHTLATRLLAGGASSEDIADIVGNTPEIVRKHYSNGVKDARIALVPV